MEFLPNEKQMISDEIKPFLLRLLFNQNHAVESTSHMWPSELTT